MGKAMHCDCEHNYDKPNRICLYHWQWIKLIDDAREAMAGNAQWMKLADEVPKSDSFPLHDNWYSKGKSGHQGEK